MVGEALLRGAEYSLWLVEGYCERARCSPTPEEIAQFLYSREDATRGVASDVHVWCVGAEGWIRNAPHEFLCAAAGETRPEYRILIRGQRAQIESGFWVDYWPKHISEAGITMRYRNDFERCRRDWMPLLRMMYRFAVRYRAAPSQVLEKLGVPFSFVGDH